MSMQEIYESEKRNEDNLYDIHFYMEGSFWRAYEWSAYLSRNFPSNLTDDERLKPIRKITKFDDDGYVQVGLQLSSFEKYLPGVVNDDNIFEMGNKHIIIHAKSFFTDFDFFDYETILNEWKLSIKLSDKEKKKNKQSNIERNDTISINSLIKELITYPMENRNLIECLQFLSYVRDKAIKINKGD